MEAKWTMLGTGALLAASIVGCAVDTTGEPILQREQAATAEGDCKEFAVTSPNFEDGEALPYAYTCEGAPFGSGVSPELNWTKGPEGTKSYAIVFVDTTILAANQPNFAFHWAAWNIPKNKRNLPEGIVGVDPASPPPVALPKSMKSAAHSQARGVQRFFGPCPSWTVTQAELCGLPPVDRVTDSYAFIIYALPEADIAVPAHDPTINTNYVDRLNAFFAEMALGQTEIHATSDAVPTTTPPVGCPAVPAP